MDNADYCGRTNVFALFVCRNFLFEKMTPILVQKLAEKLGEPLSALEIVRDLIGLQNVQPAQAAMIVDALLRDQQGFCKINDRWVYRPSLPSPMRLMFCRLFAPGREDDAVEIWLTEFAENRTSEPMVIDGSGMLSRYVQSPLLMSGLGAQLAHLRRRLPPDIFQDTSIFLLTKLLNHLFPGVVIRSESDISRALGLPFYEDASLPLQHQMFVEQCLAVIEFLRERRIESLPELEAFYESDSSSIDFSNLAFDADFLKSLPDQPGVYVMKDRRGGVLYVGKSNNLRRRLRTYFIDPEPDAKLRRIREQLYDLEIRCTDSDLEALLLEQELIERTAPSVNRLRQVRGRRFRQRERYRRILVWSQLDPNWATLLFFRPGVKLRQMSYPRVGGDLLFLREMIESVFFTEDAESGGSADEEILVSWLTQHAAQVRSIDMRLIADPTEAVRLVSAHLADADQPPSIQI